MSPPRFAFAFVMSGCMFVAMTRGDELPLVVDVDPQPLAAQARRLAEALQVLGEPLPAAIKARLDAALAAEKPGEVVEGIQEALDPLCLVGVAINPESRVKAVQGPVEPRLWRNGWAVFPIKVINEAGVTAPLVVESPNAAAMLKRSTGRPDPEPSITPANVRDRWMELRSFDDRPLARALSGLKVEYRLIQIYSRDEGSREAKLGFNVGQGTQDLGFRSEVDVLFRCRPSVALALGVKDEGGRPTTASFLFRDRNGRVVPAQSRRLAPDFAFHPQVYRRDGETIDLAPGTYDVEWTRGPEYLVQRRSIVVPDAPAHREEFPLKRWTDLAARGWISGDHHVHAAGCAHYESPTEGVAPEVMERHILGEDLKVGCVLSWGPCWYFQKQFFDGKVHALPEPNYLMRYDVEVSGFPSSHAGHLCLLRLKEDDYPETTRIEEWPSWDLPVLRWGKSQGGVVGFSHSGWGLQTKSDELPNEEIPPFDGIGANEYIVDVVHDAVDFISAVDTPAPWELNIWYHTLNCGYRCRISGETDFPCIYGERVGLGRSYVKLDGGKADFDGFVEGIKQGRSYVGDGKSHLVDFRVGDVRLGEGGSELRLDRPGEVAVTVDVAALLEPEPTPETEAIRTRKLSEQPYWDLERSRIGATRTVPLEVVVNGAPVARADVVADGQFRAQTFRISIDRSSWVALRIYPSSHTNPIWVLVDGKPVRASRRSAEWCLKGVDRCWSQKEKAIHPEERAAAEAAYEAAREAYRAIRDESAAD